MKLISKLVDNLYLPLIVIILAGFLIINGRSVWLEAIYLGIGLVAGWFLISVYLKLIKIPRLALIFSSAIFRAGFLLFSFWLVISSRFLLASGLAIGVNLFFIKEQLSGYRERQITLKRELFGDLDVSGCFLLAYMASFIFLVAFLVAFVIF
jgi:hypothetical protein